MALHTDKEVDELIASAIERRPSRKWRGYDAGRDSR
jgi:hypothetical protein